MHDMPTQTESAPFDGFFTQCCPAVIELYNACKANDIDTVGSEKFSLQYQSCIECVVRIMAKKAKVTEPVKQPPKNSNKEVAFYFGGQQLQTEQGYELVSASDYLAILGRHSPDLLATTRLELNQMAKKLLEELRQEQAT